MNAFNAWRDPWVPIRRGDGTEECVALRELYLQAHELTGLGSQLTPLDRDSLMRLLLSVGALIERKASKEGGAGTFSRSGVEAFGSEFEERFDLFGERPFLQRWDKTQADLEQLFGLTSEDPKARKLSLKNRTDKLRPLSGLHPHVPGGSSSKWAVRRDARDETQLANLTLLLVTTWFQIKNGNSRDPWGNGAVKGSAGTWHVNPLAIYFLDPTNLARTLLANIPTAWVDRCDLPVFLDHEEFPKDFSTAHIVSVSRFTYAKTLPLIYVEEGAPVGYVIGADQEIPIPELGKDDKESLGRVHEKDHTRLYRHAKGGDLVPRGAFGARLRTTEGFERWFRAENGISEALTRWFATDRLLSVGSADKRDWLLSVFSDNGDPQGNRESASWDNVPADFAGAGGEELIAVQAMYGYAAECRGSFAYAGKLATGASRTPGVAINGQVAFYASLSAITVRLQHDVHANIEIDLWRYSGEVEDLANREFARATAPLLVPSRVAEVARARAAYARLVHKARNSRFQPLEETA